MPPLRALDPEPIRGDRAASARGARERDKLRLRALALEVDAAHPVPGWSRRRQAAEVARRGEAEGLHHVASLQGLDGAWRMRQLLRGDLRSRARESLSGNNRSVSPSATEAVRLKPVFASESAMSNPTGPALAAVRRWFGVSQAEIARRAGLSRQRIAQIENDESPTDRACRLYRAALRDSPTLTPSKEIQP